MLDKRYWVAKCRHGEVGFSTYRTTREDFERQCGTHPHCAKTGDGCAAEVKEISQDDFAARIRSMPAWIKETIKFRKEAARKPILSQKDVDPSKLSSATILGWRLKLSVDCIDGPFRFHMSAKIRGKDPSEGEMTKLGEIMQVMGCHPLPELMLMNEALHFQWDAPDVEARVEEGALN